jgi:DNA-directed RNA polymerase specialized sigma24 family protein
MARDANIEARLQRWAVMLTVGDGSGYPVTSVLHENWQPPAPGQTPTLKVGASSDARQTHRAIATLSQRLANTLVVHYVMRLSLAEQAERLGCAPSTVTARIDAAHARLAAIFNDEPSAGLRNKLIVV